MNQSSLSQGKKISIVCLFLFLVGMVIATVVSENVYYDSLPAVMTGVPQRDYMRAAYNVIGSVEYQKEYDRYYARASFTSVDFFVESGAAVTIGDALYQVPADEVLLAKSRLRMSVMQLEQESAGLGGGDMAKLQREINALEIEGLNGRIAELENLYQAEGIVTADQSGIFTASVSNHAQVASGQEIGVIVRNTNDAVLHWQMSAADGKLFHVGDTVSSTITVKEIVEEKTVEKNVLYQMRITEIEQLAGGQGYRFTARIGDDVILSMDEGAGVTVNCSYISREKYANVVPLSAIVMDANGSSGTVYEVRSRERVYGQEYYVVPYQVEVEYSVGNYAALLNYMGEGEIVFYSTAALAENMAVKRSDY